MTTYRQLIDTEVSAERRASRQQCVVWPDLLWQAGLENA